MNFRICLPNGCRGPFESPPKKERGWEHWEAKRGYASSDPGGGGGGCNRFVCVSISDHQRWVVNWIINIYTGILWSDYTQENNNPVREIICGARMEDTRLTKRVMFGELVGGAGCVAGEGKIVDGVFPGLDDLRTFDINVDQWTTAAQDEGEW